MRGICSTNRTVRGGDLSGDADREEAVIDRGGKGLSISVVAARVEIEGLWGESDYSRRRSRR